MEALLERTTARDQMIAQSSIRQFEKTSKKVSTDKSDLVKIAIQDGKEFMEIPKKAVILLFSILSNMAEGKSITLVPSDSLLTTQQAADILNVSRPHLVKLLETGEIAYQKVGTHRRIELKDILLYESKMRENRKEKLAFLSRQAQELNMGY